MDALENRPPLLARMMLEWPGDSTVSPPKYLATLLTVMFLYIAAGALSLRLAFEHPGMMPFCAPAGIALAGMLLFGYRIWPAIFIGALYLHLGSLSVLAAVSAAGAATIEALFATALANCFAGGLDAFCRTRNLFRFVSVALLPATMTAAALGAAGYYIADEIRWHEVKSIWMTWWLSDAVGIISVSPLLVIGLAFPLPRWNRNKAVEALLLGCYLFIASSVVFGVISPPLLKNYPLEIICVPFLLWAAFRFGRLETAGAVLMLSILASWGVWRGFGPFIRATPNESLMVLQGFLGVAGTMTIAVASVVAERTRFAEALQAAHDELERQATTDPMTGLANYRRLVDLFNAEVERSQRTGRPFSLILFDMDRLKEINDTHGHLAGSRALCRVANTLRFHCRAVDTAARYGGDEFALLLPETNYENALSVAQRVLDGMRSDTEIPSVSVSFGIAVYPEAAVTLDGIIASADRNLYTMKHPGQSRRSA